MSTVFMLFSFFSSSSFLCESYGHGGTANNQAYQRGSSKDFLSIAFFIKETTTIWIHILNYVLNVHTLPRHSVAENIVGTPVFARADRRRVVVSLLRCLTSKQIHSTML